MNINSNPGVGQHQIKPLDESVYIDEVGFNDDLNIKPQKFQNLSNQNLRPKT